MTRLPLIAVFFSAAVLVHAGVQSAQEPSSKPLPPHYASDLHPGIEHPDDEHIDFHQESAAKDGASAPHRTHVRAAQHSSRPVHWGYEGALGAQHWAELSEAYAICAEGKQQSPINIFSSELEVSGAVQLAYQKSSLHIAHHEHVEDIVDNGHTIQVSVKEGGTLTTLRDSYELLQFHFHTPSEHTVDGKSFPMEMHLVHRSTSGQFAVVGVLFEEGESHPLLDHLVGNLPSKGEHHHFDGQELDLDLHLPGQGEVYSLLGSFTTPPCTEDVEWLIMKSPQQASKAELDEFRKHLHHNNRPIEGRGHNRHVQLLSVNVEED